MSTLHVERANRRVGERGTVEFDEASETARKAHTTAFEMVTPKRMRACKELDLPRNCFECARV